MMTATKQAKGDADSEVDKESEWKAAGTSKCMITNAIQEGLNEADAGADLDACAGEQKVAFDQDAGKQNTRQEEFDTWSNACDDLARQEEFDTLSNACDDLESDEEMCPHHDAPVVAMRGGYPCTACDVVCAHVHWCDLCRVGLCVACRAVV